jgi:3-methyladenine DNA glycosylase/8-oxoguanine DNA glycosylase
VPGLPGGLTHTFPAAPALTPARLAAAGLPAAAATAIAALAAAVTAGHPALARGADPDALAAVPGLDAELCHQLAFRLGQRDAFPSTDPALAAALADLGPASADTARWRPWRGLAAAHLMARGDRTAGVASGT